MPDEIITQPFQLTLEEKDQLFFSLLDHLELDVYRTSGGFDIRANGDAA